MEKLAFFFIDDVIWVMRDLTRQRPKSLFDNEFMKMLKKGHDDYQMTVQLNLFYRTDFFYGDDEFTLAEMTDAYKAEFEANSDWLRLAFHAKQEFPDYPYVNATYETVKANCEAIHNEIIRFAGEGSLSYAVCPHWLPLSKAGCKALADCGVKFVTPSVGETKEFTGDANVLPFGSTAQYATDESVLPYGHAARLLQNRQPETKLFTRKSKDTRISASICAYNHITDAQRNEIYGKNVSIPDAETGVSFKIYGGGPTLNLNTVETMTQTLAKLNGNEYIGTATHEQYFYPDYYSYQPDYAEKYYTLGKILKDYGYRFITADEMK